MKYIDIRSSMEHNLDTIAEAVFTRPPGEAGTVQLQLDELSAEAAAERGADRVEFEILCIITVKGIEILYGHRDLTALSEQQFEHVRRYVRSMGYELIVWANDTSMSPWDILREHGADTPLYRYRVFFRPLRA